MTGRRWWAWLPLVVGAVAAVLLQISAGGRRVYVEVAPALLALAVGVLGTAAALATLSVLGSRRRRQAGLVERTRTEANRARQRFVRRLDHELKNPLTALLAALGGPGGRLEVADRDRALAQADRLRRLLTDLRRVTDVETVELDLAPVDLSRLVHEAVAWAVADAGGTRHVRVDIPSAPRPLPRVAGDQDLLGVAVYNVVANALKYSAPGDAVEIRARELPGRTPAVLVEIADAGPGIPAEEIELVWEELARGRAAAAHPGSGIGLALVRVVIERHRGTVSIFSRLGAGTSVYLTLPAG